MRTITGILGLGVLAVLWSGGWAGQAKVSLSAHMVVHMGVVAVAAPLLAWGLAGGRFDPVKAWPAGFAAIPLSIVELIVVWGWHAPALHRAARAGGVAFWAEQAMFLVAGLLVWLSAVGGDRSQRRERAGLGVAALLLTSMHMTLLGALLALTPRVLYGRAEWCAPEAALQDQHLAGAIMLLAGGVVYLAGGVALMAEWMKTGVPEAKGGAA